ncbi:MAG: glycoside hydrolase TIM-barrel-like domain-containing protein [Rickettsiales bacterium]|jgi:hypothetical protein|nr:glycoside hydrolase TIM-barrel-like domain-containing protein [Rickettsiales bacterium]
MTTFVFTQALNVFDDYQRQTINRINSTPFGDIAGAFFQETTWKKDKISGKLSELSIQTSAYNRIIPRVYGTNKIAGNVIWLDEAKEVWNNNVATIKLSKGQKIKQNAIEYFYFLNFAIAICENEIELPKNVWADTTLLNLDDYAYRFHSGSNDQEQDPLIKSKNENCPAYRGLAYIVFENFPLSQFNNRLPNFLFEVTRKNNFSAAGVPISVNDAVDGLKLFPFCGNYLYHEKIQYRGKYSFVYNYFMAGNGECFPLNKYNAGAYSDSVLSLRQLGDAFAGGGYYCVSSTFFANQRNIGDCFLTPRAEFNFFTEGIFFIGLEILTRPDMWHVGNRNRFNAPLLESVGGKFRYFGGTPSDDSMLSIFNYIKSIGGKTIFCPNIYVDSEEKGEGKDLFGSPADVVNFFTKTDGYNDFILHYANLLKGAADVFLIGNELSGLTCLEDENGHFIAVDKLKTLAQSVRDIMGAGVKISYSAGYREYHSHNDWRCLDDLWSDNNIDFVGIKAYFPLTYTTQDQINHNVIKQGWESGEGCDYITNNGIRENIEKKDAYKNIAYWWNNRHVNPNGEQTAWEPRSKKIWFTEFGFCSIDAAANEPYLECRGNIGEPIPAFSNGNMDIAAQKLALEATLDYWKDKTDLVEKKILNCWDLRPYPYFPNKISIWPDGVEWKYNYCVNNKLNVNTVKDFLRQIFYDADIPLELLGEINLSEFIDGMVLNEKMDVRDALLILQKVCFFDCVENCGKIYFISNKASSRATQAATDVPYADLIGEKVEEENSAFVKIETLGADKLPRRLSLIFIDKNCDYDSNLVNSVREAADDGLDMIDTAPVVLDEIKAKNLSEIMLSNFCAERTVFRFSLGLKYIFLTPSDLLRLHTKNNVFLLKIRDVNVERDKINISATQFDPNIFKENSDIFLNDQQELGKFIQNAELNILELPSVDNFMLNNIYLFFGVKQNSKYWSGANLYFSNNFGREYKIIHTIKRGDPIGELVRINSSDSRPYYLDKNGSFDILFGDAIDPDFIKNLDTFELLGGENLILLGNEIMQYQTMTLNSDGSYRIKNLLRGLYGAENEINNHVPGEKFIFLGDLPYQEIGYDRKNMGGLYKIVNINGDMADAAAINYAASGRNLCPMRPCHFKLDNDALSWERVDRGNSNWIDNMENFCPEGEEEYCLEFYIENTLLKKIFITGKRKCEVPEELAGKTVAVKLSQIGKFYGGGIVLEKSFDF